MGACAIICIEFIKLHNKYSDAPIAKFKLKFELIMTNMLVFAAKPTD